MNEKQYALKLKNELEDAKLEFDKITICNNLKNLERDNIDFNILKSEVEKLGYHIELAKDIKDKYYQKEWKKEPFFVFYLNLSDVY